MLDLDVVVPVTSCGPLVHSSASILCVTLMAYLSSLDVGHLPLSPHMHVYTPVVQSPSLGLPWTCGTLHRTLLLGQVDPCCSGAGWGAAEGGTLKTLSVFHAYSHYMHGTCSGHTVAPWSTCMAVSIGGETLCMCPHSECPTSLYGKCCLPGHHLLLTRLCWCRCATGCTVMCWHHEA